MATAEFSRGGKKRATGQLKETRPGPQEIRSSIQKQHYFTQPNCASSPRERSLAHMVVDVQTLTAMPEKATLMFLQHTVEIFNLLAELLRQWWIKGSFCSLRN